MKFKLIFCFVFMLLLIGNISASEINLDNIKGDLIIDDTTSSYGKIKIKDWFGLQNLIELELKQNTDTCGRYCSSKTNIKLSQETELVEDIRFMELKEDGSWVKSKIRNYQLYTEEIIGEKDVEDYDFICSITGKFSNGTNIENCSMEVIGTHKENIVKRTPYNIREEKPIGNYKLILEGEKKPSRTIDWQIKTNGKWINEWANWSGTSLLNNLQSYYTFNDTTSDLIDIVSDGDLIEIGTIQSAIGISNNSRGNYSSSNYFNGSIASDINMTGNSEWTISIWFNATSHYDSNREIVVFDGLGASELQWHIRIDNESKLEILYLLRGTDTTTYTSTDNVTLNEWNNVIVRQNSTNVTFIHNGSVVHTFSIFGGSTPVESVIIGYNLPTTSSGALDVYIDELAIFNRSLTDNEISDIYSSGSCIPYPFEYGVVTLNSPVDNYNSTITNNLLNASAIVYGGANLTNISLWTNVTGTWGLTNTTQIILSTTDLYSWYKLDDLTTPEGNIIDYFGGIDATNHNTTSGELGIIEYAQNFTEDNKSYIDLGYKLPDEFTIEVWLNPAKLEDRGFMGEISIAGGTKDGWQIDLNLDGTLDVIYYKDDVAELSATTTETISVGNWNHFVLTSDNSRNVISYINNVAESLGTIGTIPNQHDKSLKLGSSIFSQVALGQTYNGKIDEVSIWNDSISSSQVSDFYNFGNARRINSSSLNTFWNVSFDEGTYIWNVEACDTDGDCGFAEANRTINIDTFKPNINVTSPNAIINLHEANTNLNLTWNITDVNLENCWYDYNGTNIIVNCSNLIENFTSFNVVGYDNRNLTFYANDTYGNINNSIISWNYKVFRNSQIYENETTELSQSNFSVNLTYDSSAWTSITGILNYDSVNYSSTSESGSGDIKIINRTLNIPAVSSDENKTFFWYVRLTNASGIFIYNSSTNNQTIRNVGVDDCSVNTNVLFNLTYVDETTQELINFTNNIGAIEVDIEIYSIGGETTYINYSNEFKNDSNVAVCLNNNLSSGNLYLDSKFKYYSTKYQTEYYNIRNYLLNKDTLTQNITLYGLNSSYATIFDILYKNSDFSPVKDALIDITKEYVSEGVFKTIEIPITDIDGKTTASLVKDDAVYTFNIYKEGTLLSTFENVIPVCKNELTEECQINLNEISTTTNIDDFTALDDLSYVVSWDAVTKLIRLSFSTITGASEDVNLLVLLFDTYENETICDISVTSASGTLTCTIPDSYVNQTAIIKIYKDDVFISRYTINLSQNPVDFFGYSGYFFALIMIIMIPFMFISSPIGMVVGMIIGVVLTSLLLISTSASIYSITGGVIWFIIASVILIWKLNDTERR